MAANGEKYDHHRGREPLLQPSGRLRTGVFLAVNLAGFLAVNAFWQYLATGRWINFPRQIYQSMRTPLPQTLMEPIDILTHPWMILVAGLLLGLVILVPLVVSVLYRLLFAGLFVLIVAAVGHAPVLAVAVAAGCILAARTPLRSDMPFLAVVIGLVPVALYFYLLFAMAWEAPPVALPIQRWVLYAPFVVAAVSAVVGGAVILLLAKLTRFRPGAVWPVLAVLLVAPMSVFYAKIGPAELEYSVLVDNLAPGDTIFDPVALDVWKRKHGAEALEGLSLEERIRQEMNRQRRRLLDKCQAFLDSFPGSSRAADAQWIKAQCLSLALDTEALAQGLVRYSAGHYLPGSAPAWQRAAPAWEHLKTVYPASPQAALADWRLGELAVCQGSFLEGYRQLRRSAEQLRTILPALTSDSKERGGTGVFTGPQPLPDRRHYVQALFEVERMLWLIEQNHILEDARLLSPQEQSRLMGAREALRAYLMTSPNDREALERLSLTYMETHLADNLKLAAARATTDLNNRTAMLLDLSNLRHEGRLTDAAVAANWYLGLLAMSPAEVDKLHAALAARLNAKRPEAYFQAIVETDQQPWKRLAEERLAALRQPAAVKSPR